MIRKFTTLLFSYALLLGVGGCGPEEVNAPPKATVSVDKTTGLAFDDEFTFTIRDVGANNTTLYPYGIDMARLGTVAVSSFESGTAVVKFKYSHTGTFAPVVVTNNNNQEGSFRNVVSDALSVTITSDKHSITEFSFGSDQEGVIDQGAKTIAVTVPYGFNITNAKAVFKASEFAVVTVGGATQVSGTTENNFTNPVTYTVTSQNGAQVSNYVVTVSVTPAEQNTQAKSASGKLVSTGAINGREIPGFVDNTNNRIVLYDTLGTPATSFDSVQVTIELEGEFAFVNYQNKRLAGQTLNLTSAKTVRVNSQDSVNVFEDFNIYALQAPKITVSSVGLVPQAVVTYSGFDVAMSVLKGTNIQTLSLNLAFELPPNTTLTAQKINDAVYINGTPVDAEEPLMIEAVLTNTNLGISYTVTYKLTVTQLP